MAKKRLYKNESEAMIGGVCQGISEYLDGDVSVVRLIAVLLLFASFGTVLILYIVMMIILPDKSKVYVNESIEDVEEE